MTGQTLFFGLSLWVAASCAWAQSVTIDPKAASTSLINAVSTGKGILPPRMTSLQRNTLTLSPGLQVYCTDCTPVGPYSYNGSTWIPMFETGSGISFAIGQGAQGGVVFWLDPSSNGQHGLAAAAADQSTGIQWFNNNFTNTNAVRAGAYGGAYNTERINDNQGNGTYASMLAAQYNGGNYGDWYLPSKDELNLMFAQKGVIGGFENSNYWSSTEIPAAPGEVSETVAVQNFSSGAQTNVSKSTNTIRVRAIRRF